MREANIVVRSIISYWIPNMTWSSLNLFNQNISYRASHTSSLFIRDNSIVTPYSSMMKNRSRRNIACSTYNRYNSL
uniref:Uncharacterized protein n=1 Tax=Iridovirus sp. TaxID=135728 RepID=A0AAU7YCT3_9VIRU